MDFQQACDFYGFDESAVDDLRSSLTHLAPNLSDLIRRLNEAMKSAPSVGRFGEFEPDERERLQKIFAAIVTRVTRCTFDETFVAEVSDVVSDGFPRGFLRAAFVFCGEFVVTTLPELEDDCERLAAMQSSWMRLLGALADWLDA